MRENRGENKVWEMITKLIQRSQSMERKNGLMKNNISGYETLFALNII